MLDDVTTAATQYALRGLTRRADVRAHNIANVNTPGHRAQMVDFESTLRDAVRSGDVGRLRETELSATPSLTGPQPNSVDMETELVGSMKDNLQRDALVNAYNSRTAALRTVLKDGQ